MSAKTYFYITGAVLLAIAVLHIIRAIYNLPAEVSGVVIPIWASWVSAVLAGYLAFSAYRLSRRP